MIARAAMALLLAAEALAFYTVGELVMRILPEPTNEMVSAPAFLLLAFVAFLAPAALDWFAVEGRRRALTLALLGLVALYAVLRLQYAGDLALWDFGWAADVAQLQADAGWVALTLVSVVLLLANWMRADWRARSGDWIDAAPRSLAIAFAVVTLALLAAAASEQSALVTRGGVVFYGVALGALALAQLSQGGSIGGLRSGGVTTTLLVGTGAFAALGVLLVGVLLDPLVDALTTPASAIGKALVWFLTWVIFYPLAWVLNNLYELFLTVFGGDRDAEPLQPELPEPIEVEGGDGAEADEGESLASQVTRYVVGIGSIVLGVAVVGALLFILGILRRRARGDADAMTESERSGSLADDLREAARGLFRRDRRPPAGEGVTRLYLDVLEEARRAGAPRPEGRTPREFAPDLTATLHRDVTDEITAAFEAARYAGRAPNDAALADLRRRWEQSP